MTGGVLSISQPGGDWRETGEDGSEQRRSSRRRGGARRRRRDKNTEETGVEGTEVREVTACLDHCE